MLCYGLMCCGMLCCGLLLCGMWTAVLTVLLCYGLLCSLFCYALGCCAHYSAMLWAAVLTILPCSLFCCAHYSDDPLVRASRLGNDQEKFFGSLFLGLYYSASGEQSNAQTHLTQAVQSEYYQANAFCLGARLDDPNHPKRSVTPIQFRHNHTSCIVNTFS